MVSANQRIFELRLQWLSLRRNRPNIFWPAVLFSVTDHAIFQSLF